MKKENTATLDPFLNRPCPVCQGDDSEQLFMVAADPYYQQEHGISTARIVNCRTCGTCHTNPILRDEFNEAQYLDPESGYNQSQCSSPEQVIWADQLICYHELVRHAHPGADVLDFGCGEGGLVYLCQKGGFRAHGIELNPAAVTRAARLGIKNISSIPLAELPKNSCDCITVLHVLEHLPECATFVKAFRRLLKKEGYIFIMVPNYHSLKLRLAPMKYWGHPFQHMNAFCFQNLDFLFSEAGFKRVPLRAKWAQASGLSRKIRISMLMTKYFGNWFSIFPMKLFTVYQKIEKKIIES